jgi:hypothetical protein
METMRKLSLHKKVGTLIFMLNPTTGISATKSDSSNYRER